MEGPAQDRQGSIELIYKEYVRLSDRCALYVQSSFDDIKLYGAIGVVFAWKPISELSLFSGTGHSVVLLLGFIGLLVVTTAISIFTLVRQSLVVYYLEELRGYESALREWLPETQHAIFRWTETYPQWRYRRVIPVTAHLYLLTFLVVGIAPIAILLQEEPRWHAWLYAAAGAICGGLFMSALRMALRRVRQQA